MEVNNKSMEASRRVSQILVKGEIPGFGAPHQFLEAYTKSPEMQQQPEYQQIHHALVENASVCSFCGVGCPFTVAKGESGNERLIPLSDLGLCVKGQSSLISGGDHIRPGRLAKRGLEDDRIRSPMIRGHDGKLKEVSWDEALDRAAWLFLHIREWVGPQGVAVYGNGQKSIESIWLASLYKLVFNIPTIGANSEHCLSSAGAAHVLNFGNEASFTMQQFSELDDADVIVLHGTNPKITFPQAFAKLKRNENARKVVIDPVRSDTAIDLLASGSHNRHVRFEQGGDILFNLCVSRIILENGWQDDAYLTANVDGPSLVAFKALCFQPKCEPASVAKQIALEGQSPEEVEATIREYAAMIAKPDESGHRPRVAFVSSMGINQSTGSIGFSTNLNLLLLTGNVGRKGAGSLRIAGQSNATSELMLGFNSRKLVFNLDPTVDAHREQLSELLDLPIENIPNRVGTPVSQMADDDFLYCFIFIGTQFTRNMPRLGHWLRRLGRSFNIVIDAFMPEGVDEYADVVFPSLTYTERSGVIQRGDRTLQLQQPITPAPELAWPDEQILARLAVKIGERLKNPNTAAMNGLDPEVVTRTFARYLDKDGSIQTDQVFDHVVATSQALNLYNRLEDAEGEPISHASLKYNAGWGVQWQGNNRYHSSQDGPVAPQFPGLNLDQRSLAKLVCPPDRLIERLVDKGNDHLRSLITGRGRPGRNQKHYIARYNSGIKTLPVTGEDDSKYWIEIHPEYASQLQLEEGDLVRIASYYGVVFCHVSVNDNVPKEYPFLDFVPGEVNRLTNYLDNDQYSNQSLIKRTPIRLEQTSQSERVMWDKPDSLVIVQVLSSLRGHLRQVYPEYADMKAFYRREARAKDWLSWETLRNPQTPAQHELVRCVAALSIFLQRYMNDKAYRSEAKGVLQGFDTATRADFFTVLLPLLRKMDYSTALLPLLSDCVGELRIRDEAGKERSKNLFDAHNSAVLELKEEVVGVQLFVALKRAFEIMYGEGAVVPHDDIAVVSGIAIPCAADVPAYILSIAPSDLQVGRLVHSRAIGGNAIMVVDCKTNQAVKVDVKTGVLPKDKELNSLRAKVIARKQAGTADEHRRFFDVLEELITEYVERGDDNFDFYHTEHICWQEFRQKLSFAPAKRQAFRHHLVDSRVSPELTRALVELDVLDAKTESKLITTLTELLPTGADAPDYANFEGVSVDRILANPGLTTSQKVATMIEEIIAPVLENDGGRLELIEFTPDDGEVSIRFVGSCANCPCSMLSLENIVKPPLLLIDGVSSVVHRGLLKSREAPQTISLTEVS